MKRLIIFMMLLFLIAVPVSAEELPLPGPEGLTDIQKIEVSRIKDFVADLREKLPTVTHIVTPENFESTVDMLEYLLQGRGFPESEYFISGGVREASDGEIAVFYIKIRMVANSVVFFIVATFEFQDIEGEPI